MLRRLLALLLCAVPALPSIGQSSGDLLKMLAARQALGKGPMTAGRYLALGDLRHYVDEARRDPAFRPRSDFNPAQKPAPTPLAIDPARLAAARSNAVVKAAVTETKVTEFLRMQADEGSARAKFDYGERLLAGRGTETNSILGWAYIQAAADLGHEPAKVRVKQAGK